MRRAPPQARALLLGLLCSISPPFVGCVPKADGTATAARRHATPRAAHIDRPVAEVRETLGVQTEDAFGSLLEMFDGDKDGVLTFDELSELKELLLGSTFGLPSRATPLPDLIRTQGLTGAVAMGRASRSPVDHGQFIERFGPLLTDAEATYDALDIDKDGSLSPKEFVKLHEHVPSTMDYSSFAKWYHMRLARTDDDGATMYKALDLDGDEMLSAAEIGRMNDVLLRMGATVSAPNPLKAAGVAAKVAPNASPNGDTRPEPAATADSTGRRSAGGVSAKEWAAIVNKNAEFGGGNAQTPIDLSTAPNDADYSNMLQRKGWLDFDGATVRKDLLGLFPLLDADGDGSLTGREQTAFELLMTESGMGPMDPYANPLSAAAARRGELPLLHRLLRPVAPTGSSDSGDLDASSTRPAGLDSVLFARLFRVLVGTDLAPLLSGEAQQIVLEAQPRGFTRGPEHERGQAHDVEISASPTDAGVYATPEVDGRVAPAAHTVDLAQIFSSLDADSNGVLEGAEELGPLSTTGPPYHIMPTDWSEAAFCFWFVEAFPSAKVGPRVFRNWDVDSDGMLTQQEAAGLLPTLLDGQRSGQKIPIDMLLNEPSMGMDRVVFARRFSERLPGVMDVEPIFTTLDADVNGVVTPSELRQVQRLRSTAQHKHTAKAAVATSRLLLYPLYPQSRRFTFLSTCPLCGLSARVCSLCVHFPHLRVEGSSTHGHPAPTPVNTSPRVTSSCH